MPGLQSRSQITAAPIAEPLYWLGSGGARHPLCPPKKVGRGQIEPAMYARLYLIYGYLEGNGFNVVKGANADPEIMKAGLEKLRHLYPYSDYVLNETAHYYCSTDDRAGYETVRRLLKNHVSSLAWPDYLSLASCSAYL